MFLPHLFTFISEKFQVVTEMPKELPLLKVHFKVLATIDVTLLCGMQCVLRQQQKFVKTRFQ